MAEILGVVASAFSVVSLTVQLGDSLRKAADFWELVEDGPNEIRRISTELRFLASILNHIQHVYTLGTTSETQDSLMKHALTTTKSDIDALAYIINGLSVNLQPDRKTLRRKWVRVKIALADGKLTKIKNYIESAKNNINILQSTINYVSMANMAGKFDAVTAQLSLVTIRRPAVQVKAAVMEREIVAYHPLGDGDAIQSSSLVPAAQNGALRLYNKHSRSAFDTNLFKLRIHSTTSHIIDEDEVETENSKTVVPRPTYVINMAWRFLTCRRDFRLTTNNNFDSWSFNTMRRRRPDDCQVFELAWEGNVRGIHKLLLSGDASIFDVDPRGWTLLHYACSGGRSELVEFLVTKGADIYQRTDDGEEAAHALACFDILLGEYSRSIIATIMRFLIDQAFFDPFKWRRNGPRGWQTCRLCNGLPYEILQYSLTNDFHHSKTREYMFIRENLLALKIRHDDALDSINYLIKQYENLRSDETTDSQWPGKMTLLQDLIIDWLHANKNDKKGSVIKISRALELTNDLYWDDGMGTPVDCVANINAIFVQDWLQILLSCGINMEEYVAYEESQHLDGIIRMESQCCRVLRVTFNTELPWEDCASIKIDSICDPQYEHLDAEYRCPEDFPRQNCISHLDDVFIGEDGKQIQPLPGSFVPSLARNSELSLAISLGWKRYIWLDTIDPKKYMLMSEVENFWLEVYEVQSTLGEARYEDEGDASSYTAEDESEVEWEDESLSNSESTSEHNASSEDEEEEEEEEEDVT